MSRTAWKRSCETIVAQLQAIRGRIDRLGDEAVTIVGGDQPDQVACYASNSIEGTLALLRDLERLVSAKPRRTRRTVSR